MPIFEYRCAHCHSVRGELLPQPEAALVCDQCQGIMTRVVSSFMTPSETAENMYRRSHGHNRHTEWLDKNASTINRKLRTGEYSIDKT